MSEYLTQAFTLFADAFQALWGTEGVSEFMSALLGGGFAIFVQALAIKRDREKDKQHQTERSKAVGWGIYFKMSLIHEALYSTKRLLIEARERAKQQGVELWQVLQFPPHDWKPVDWDSEELVLLLDHELFEIMQSYQEATWWISNLVQSTRLYREMRVELLNSVPATMSGNTGTANLTPTQFSQIQPKIAHLSSLAESFDVVFQEQADDARKLLLNYTDKMTAICGRKPNLEFRH